MKKKYLLYPLLFLVTFFQAFSASSEARPNIIFILTDDHRYDALGFMGAYPWLETPNLDRLAKGGAHFKNAFATTSVCAPSRASFLTGLYAHKHGVASNQDVREPNWDKTPSFGQYLNELGYRTGYIGKWHMYHHNMNRPGWDFWATFSDQGKYYGNHMKVNGEPVFEEGYVTDVLTDYALDFIRTSGDSPYLLYLSHKAVHAPFTPADRDAELYQSEAFVARPNQLYSMAGKPHWQQQHAPGTATFVNRKLTKSQAVPTVGPVSPANVNNLFNSMRSLKAVDTGLGRIVALLAERGELDNTVIVYAGDNGFLFGEHRRGDKRVAYEESMRIPILMHWPKEIPAGTVISKTVLNVDVAPTFLDIVGVPDEEYSMDGRSLRALWQHEHTSWRDGFLYAYYRDLQSIIPTIVAYRGDRYKIVKSEFRDGDIQELYDLETDPYELNNLYYDPSFASIRDQMTQALELEKELLGYKSIVPDPNPSEMDLEYGLLLDYSATSQGRAFGRSFKASSQVRYPRQKNLVFAHPVYRIHLDVTVSANGVIASQGNQTMGIMAAVSNGKFRFILFRGKTQYILETAAPIIGQRFQATLEYDNRVKIARLLVEGQPAESTVLSNIYGWDAGSKGDLTIGRVRDEFLPLKLADLDGHSFEGELHSFVVERNPEL